MLKILSTGFYLGKAPFAPGTFGSLVGVVLYFFIWRWLSPIVGIITLLPFVLLCVWIAQEAVQFYNNDDDPKEIVIDEIAGVLIAYALHPFSWTTVIVGFILFRIFDIWKPYPIRKIEDNLSGGWGIVMDDVLAGVYANTVMWGIFYLI